MTFVDFKVVKMERFSNVFAFNCLLNLFSFHKNLRSGGEVLPYAVGLVVVVVVGGGGATGFAKVLPFTRPNFVVLYQTKNARLFLISIFCEQFCLKGPYTRLIFYDY